MYTKILLTIAVLFSVTASFSKGNATHKRPGNVQHAENNNVSSSGDNQQSDFTFALIDFSNKIINHSGSHNHDDDGKPHHFHFENFSPKCRRKMLYCFLAKLFLLFTHVCWLAGIFVQLMH